MHAKGGHSEKGVNVRYPKRALLSLAVLNHRNAERVSEGVHVKP